MNAWLELVLVRLHLVNQHRVKGRIELVPYSNPEASFRMTPFLSSRTATFHAALVSTPITCDRNTPSHSRGAITLTIVSGVLTSITRLSLGFTTV